ncbi:MAG TPA: hypothetical protein DCL86_16590, partial [Bacteroidales bacterium]|nr:hypothetical protein [Bacteroidales bacterium]
MRLRIKNSTYLWIITLLITLGAAYYQRITGPTQPLRGVKEIGPDKLKYKLIRTFGGPGDAEITINDEKGEYEGSIRFKRYKSYDEWTSMSLKRRDGKLVGYLPHQPPAGKMEYYIIIYQGSKQISLTDEPVILR